jgi:serine/threonine protein kinase
MEKCLEPISPQFMPGKEDLFRLKKKLKVLHYFKIVHMDIKPLNIMFSQCNKELVFIDFGLSKMTSLPQGWKVVTGFMGTLNYCSLEMKKNYLKPLNEC